MAIRINLALQGGGAHGAFTWGVLDRLLEDDEIEIAAISGTSAGALNGAALKSGLVSGGRKVARQCLDQLWSRVGVVGDFRMAAWMKPLWPYATAWTEAMETAFSVSPQGIAAQVFSPYVWGPGWRNPLEPVVRHFDFTKVCAGDGPDLHVSATNVRTGKIRVFSGQEVSPEALLASACLPTVFQAVEFADPRTGRTEAFWDGGYTGNPALFPLYEPHLPDDIVIVAINPLLRDNVPDTPPEIQNRINEISFNAALLGELRAVNFVKRLIAEGRMPKGAMKDVLLHLVADEALMNELTATTKILPSPQLLARLKAAGRAAADGFLQRHKGDLNRRPSVDLPRLFG